jgi:Fe2+ transport system protein FeoA
MTDLMKAPRGLPLRVVDISGGEGVRRRLFSLGIHPGDLIEFLSQGIMGGPVLIRPVGSGVTIAIGRGVARKILVEICHESS